MVERLVTADPPRETGVAENAERNRRKRWRKHHARRLSRRLGRCDRPETLHPRQQQGTERNNYGGHDHQCAFRPRRIHQSACRRLRHDPGDGGDRHHNADTCLVPMLLGEKIDRQIRPKAVAHIGETEIRCVERALRRGETGVVHVIRAEGPMGNRKHRAEFLVLSRKLLANAMNKAV